VNARDEDLLPGLVSSPDRREHDELCHTVDGEASAVGEANRSVEVPKEHNRLPHLHPHIVQGQLCRDDGIQELRMYR